MAERPSDFSLRYSWTAAPVPPPYHYEYEISLTSTGDGLIKFWPDYPSEDVPCWTTRFSAAEEDVDAVYELCRQHGVFSRRWRRLKYPPLGGETIVLQVTSAMKTVRISNHMAAADQLEPLYALIIRLVPNALWQGLNSKHTAYMAAQQQLAQPTIRLT